VLAHVASCTVPVVKVATVATRSVELPNFSSKCTAGFQSVPALKSVTEVVYTSDWRRGIDELGQYNACTLKNKFRIVFLLRLWGDHYKFVFFRTPRRSVGELKVYFHLVLTSERGGGEQSTWNLVASTPDPWGRLGTGEWKKNCRCGMEPYSLSRPPVNAVLICS
jgi:hypothetical protein